MDISDWFDDEDLPFLFVLYDMDTNKFIKVSRSALKILGYDPQDMEGKPFYEFIAKDELISAMAEVEKNKEANHAAEFYPTHYHSKKGDVVLLTWCSERYKKKRLMRIMAWPGKFFHNNTPKEMERLRE